MTFGMNLLLWCDTVTADRFDLLDAIAGWGFDGVEVGMYAPLERTPWDELVSRLDRAGLRRTAVTVVPETANPISDDPVVRRAAGEHLRECVELCARHGFETLAGPLGSPVGRLVGRGPTRAEWQRAVDVLGPVAARAAELGVALAYEPLNRFETYFLNGLDDTIELVDAIGSGCGILFDTFHANLEEKQLGDAVRAAGERIAGVHASENDRSTPGAGHVPWAEVAEALEEVGYDGWVTIEAFGQALPDIAAATCIWRRMYETEEKLARDGLAFLRRTFG